MKYKRIYIEKKAEYDIKSNNLYDDFKNYLEVENLEYVRLINLYEIVGINDEEKESILNNVLWENDLEYYSETLELETEEEAFRVKLLDNQYNKKEDMTEQIISNFLLDKKVDVYHSEIIVLKGISKKDLNKIKSYYINPIESEEVELDAEPKRNIYKEVDEIEIIKGFIKFDEKELEDFKYEYGIGIDMDDLLLCQDYFKEKKRDPSITELKLVDTYWSDHCRHTTFNTEITDIKIDNGKYKKVFEESIKNYIKSREYTYNENLKNRPVSLMDLGTINMRELEKNGKLDNKEKSKEVNAASIEIDVDINGVDEKWLLMFKNETHNHPTEMEPFGGAATCLGGAIRDPLSGRAFVYQAMRISGSSDPREKFENTIEGKLPQRYITQNAMRGYSSYGNEIGAATSYVREYYDEGFLAKRLECGALVAAAPKSWVTRADAEPGDVVVLVGGRTGKDGLGGAVGSSRKHTEESLEESGAEVQKGNPSLERKIMRLFRKKEVSKIIKICNDFGAGGVGVAIGELADGITIDLDKVPLKYEGLNGTEIALSESQERMAVVIDKKDLDFFLEETRKEDLEGTHVATVTEEKILRMKWKNKNIVNIDRNFLNTNGAKKYTEVFISSPKEQTYFEDNNIEEIEIYEDKFKELVKDLNIASQKGLIENFDNTVGGTSVLMPYGGKYRKTPAEGMVAKIPVENGYTRTCSIMTHGYDPNIGKWSPYHGGYYAVIDSVARVVALGGDYRKIRLSFQEYFERLDGDKYKWGKTFSALLGAYEVQRVLEIPSIGGKDSMSGTFEDLNVPPTLISFAVTTDKIDNIISSEFKSTNSNVVVIESKQDDYGLIDLEDLKLKYEKIKRLIDNGKIKAAHSVKNGGIARSILEMSFGNKIGFKYLDKKEIFSPKYGSIIIELEDENVSELLEGIDYRLLGKTLDQENILINNEAIEIDSIIDNWEIAQENTFPIGKDFIDVNSNKDFIYNKGIIIENKKKIEKPKVLIPVLTGTHGEYTMKKAFEKAGAEVEIFVFKTKNPREVKSSYKEFINKIKESNIIGFPDGKIMGNAPDSSGKLLNVILNNKDIHKAMEDHLNKDDGLVIGVGNGFNGLIKSGFIEGPFNITNNASNKFISEVVDVKLKSNLSPWTKNMNLEEIYSVPIATSEGRIVITEGGNIGQGQIVSQLINNNFTGSDYNINALTSLDGRVFGCLGLVDRIDKDLYKNIDIKSMSNIFKSGVEYFK